jgi:prolyl 4-hydroxylase
VNRNTIHHGMKVRSGTKYIITKWFRERGFGPMFHRGGVAAAPST